jgi:hypothetical protein
MLRVESQGQREWSLTELAGKANHVRLAIKESDRGIIVSQLHIVVKLESLCSRYWRQLCLYRLTYNVTRYESIANAITTPKAYH